MGIFWIMSLILEFLMLVTYAILATGFIGLYISRKQAIMLRLFIFAISMLAFFGIMIYLTYYLALRFGYPLAFMVLSAMALVFVGSFFLLKVVES